MKIGTFTFGGGYAMIPLIQRETVVKRKWVDDEDILNIVAIAESTPGPIAINTSTFVGYRVGGFWGAVVGTAGMILPSFVIILAISFVLKRFQDIQIVKYAFNGIRAGVLALIIRALWLMYKNVKKSAVTYIVMAAAFVLCAFADVNVIIVIASCALFGLITSYIKQEMRSRIYDIYQIIMDIFKIGAFTFGGGYAMLPLVESEVVAHGWMDEQDIVNFIAVSESTPGSFAVNVATYVGEEVAGIAGSVCATLGVVLPSFIIILIIAGCYKKFRDSGIIKGCMSGLKPAVVGLIGASVISVGREVFIPDGLAVEIFKAAGTYVSAGILVIALILSFKKYIRL